MCTGGGKQDKKMAKAQQAAQAESLALQREQLQLARQAQERSTQQYQEQLRISTAPPPPPPAPVADVAASALTAPVAGSALSDPGGNAGDNAARMGEALAINPALARQGYGRRRFRTDMAGGTGGLSIPAA